MSLTVSLTKDHKLAESKVFVSIGSNLGDPRFNCKEAINKLTGISGIKLAGISSFYRTAPIGVLNQNWFINCVISLTTTLEPLALMGEFKTLEDTMGRIRSGRWQERLIDIDLLLYDDKILNCENLILPHPRMHERGFVLVPMVEIASEIIHPVLKKDMRSILSGIKGQEIYRTTQ